MKRFSVVIFLIIVFFQAITFISFAKEEYIIVKDEYISAQTIKKLNVKAANIYSEYGFSVYFVMNDEVTKNGAYNFSRDFYDSKIKKNGIVFCMDAESGSCYVYGGDEVSEADGKMLMKAYADYDAENTGERVGAYLESAAELAERIFASSKKPESERLMPRFMDLADVIENSRENSIYADIDSFSESKLADVVFVIYSGSEAAHDYADKYYKEYNFGFGETKEGVILAVCADKGTSYIKAFGNAVDYFKNVSCADINDSLSSYRKSKDYIHMFVAYLDKLNEVMIQDNKTEDVTSAPETAVSPFGGEAGEKMSRINDIAQIISPQTIKEVSLILDEVSTDTGLDFAVVTVNDFPEGITAKDYAEQYYYHYDFGFGSEKNGVLMVISLEPESCFLSAYGKASVYFGKGDLKKYTESFYTQYKKENYDEAVTIFARECAERLMREKLELPIAASIILLLAAFSVVTAMLISKKKTSAEKKQPSESKA